MPCNPPVNDSDAMFRTSCRKPSEECSLRRFRQSLEKSLNHHFGCSVDQPLANRRDRASYLRVSFVGRFGTSPSRPELQQALAFHALRLLPEKPAK